MADLTIKQHDTYPPLTAALKTSGVAIDLTTATAVKVILKGATVTVTGTCTVTGASTGAVSYQWVTGDTAVADTYNGEFEVTWSDGKIETIPNDSYFTVVIKADLG